MVMSVVGNIFFYLLLVDIFELTHLIHNELIDWDQELRGSYSDWRLFRVVKFVAVS